MADTNFTLFETLDSANGCDINAIPWVGYIKENELVLYCNDDFQYILVDGNNAIIKFGAIRYESPYKLPDLPLQTKHIYDSETNVGYYIGPIDVIGNYEFEDESLTKIEIGSRVTEISQNAFSGCTGLKKVILNDGLQTIDDYAFRGCSVLNSINIPDSVTAVGENAFYNCGFGYLVPYGLMYADTYLIGCEPMAILPSPQIREKTRWIGTNAFKNNTYLTSIVIPKNICQIQSNAFYGCSNLTTVTLNSDYIVSRVYSSNTNNISTIFGSQAINYTIDGDVKTIGRNAFYMSPITSVTIGNSVEKIDKYAFQSCNLLSFLSLGSGLKTIDDSAFRSCSSLTSLTIPDSVTHIADHAFRQCSSLTVIDLGTGLKMILKSAFADCIGLTSISLPASLTSIGNGVFRGCSNLSYVSYEGTILQWGSVSLGLSPFSNTQVTVIHCSDGDVTL